SRSQRPVQASACLGSLARPGQRRGPLAEGHGSALPCHREEVRDPVRGPRAGRKWGPPWYGGPPPAATRHVSGRRSGGLCQPRGARIQVPAASRDSLEIQLLRRQHADGRRAAAEHRSNRLAERRDQNVRTRDFQHRVGLHRPGGAAGLWPGNEQNHLRHALAGGGHEEVRSAAGTPAPSGGAGPCWCCSSGRRSRPLAWQSGDPEAPVPGPTKSSEATFANLCWRTLRVRSVARHQGGERAKIAAGDDL
ncbi:unnamed protein product, partial [Symbiodinium sp. KB8]